MNDARFLEHLLSGEATSPESHQGAAQSHFPDRPQVEAASPRRTVSDQKGIYLKTSDNIGKEFNKNI